MKSAINLMVFVLISMLSNHANSQTFQIEPSQNVTRSVADDMFPQWSYDDSKLVFQSNRNGNWDLYYYDLNDDTTVQITSTAENEQNPVWIEKDQSIVYDSDRGGEEHLYKLDIKSGLNSLLFNRKVEAKQASFPDSELLVYFSGFDDLDKKWKVYSYEFVYNNLNQLSREDHKNYSPKVTKNGQMIVYLSASSNQRYHHLKTMNWYGNTENTFTEYNALDPFWSRDGLKLYFISDMDEKSGEVYSSWFDGSHFERLTNDKLVVRCPAVSNDGQFIALSVKGNDGFDIYIIPLDDY